MKGSENEMATSQKRDIDLGIVRYESGNTSRVFRAVLEIETSKHYHGGPESDCRVMWEGDHSRQHLFGIGSKEGGDFSKDLKRSARDVKATQKAIDRQHAEVFTSEVVAGLVEAAKAYYADVVAAGMDGFKNVYPRCPNCGLNFGSHVPCGSFAQAAAVAR